MCASLYVCVQRGALQTAKWFFAGGSHSSLGRASSFLCLIWEDKVMRKMKETMLEYMNFRNIESQVTKIKLHTFELMQIGSISKRLFADAANLWE